MTKTEVKQEVEKLLKANSLCPEGREAVQGRSHLEGCQGSKGKGRGDLHLRGMSNR